MNPLQLNLLAHTWWRFTNKKQYRLYKQQMYQEKIDKFLTENKVLTFEEIKQLADNTGKLNFLHTGNAGDIIYALPVIKKLHELVDVPLNLILKLNEPLRLAKGMTHPLNNVMLNTATANFLKPLLVAQPYISSYDIFTNQVIDINLSLFRKAGIRQDRGNIARWNFYTTGITANLSEKWLFVDADKNYSDTIVVARSQRYNNPVIDYSFLNNYSNTAFIGVKSEYEAMKKLVPNIRWVQVADFLEMARIIAGAKFFIGNQSFPFSIAEALKVPRILEAYHAAPNVVVEGADGYDFYFQNHFESVVKQLNSRQ
ncbi:hypothetical protein [Mucilaginibacter sp. KACC 22063]|uniref:hypothetical protein n=1 Tax=Mucilaginibacter sp. KACC 22063 TaxID=3025666 RepID=UPI0023663AA3|nr:hypothetical protein [Mucilaginibacter sp. KACC 22063]WDF55173.1 hypothetical protein PQ461_19770 [Mucilaginibacter sp. KACC 22063]